MINPVAIILMVLLTGELYVFEYLLFPNNEKIDYTYTLEGKVYEGKVASSAYCGEYSTDDTTKVNILTHMLFMCLSVRDTVNHELKHQKCWRMYEDLTHNSTCFKDGLT